MIAKKEKDTMNSLFGKIQALFTEIKDHWNTPAEGKYDLEQLMKESYNRIASALPGEEFIA